MQPLNDTIIFEVIEDEKKTESGIILATDDSKKDYVKGKVAAVGPDTDVEVGDRVIFPMRALSTIEVDDKEYLVGKHKDGITRY